MIIKPPDAVVAFILDASGSMSGQCAQTVAGVNEYVEDLKEKNKGKKVLFTLTKFNYRSEVLHAAIPITDIPKFTEKDYSPDGGTALYDAVGETIQELEKRLDEDTTALVVILTDGHENSSRKFTIRPKTADYKDDRIDLREIIDAKKNEGWTFVFLGEGEDAWMAGRDLGAHSSMNLCAQNMKGTMRGVSRATQSYVETCSAGSCVDSAEAFKSAYESEDKN